ARSGMREEWQDRSATRRRARWLTQGARADRRLRASPAIARADRLSPCSWAASARNVEIAEPDHGACGRNRVTRPILDNELACEALEQAGHEQHDHYAQHGDAAFASGALRRLQ